MDYASYSRTLNEHQAIEQQKVPGQKFCDNFGWRLKMNGYIEMQRPDRITNIQGTIYRTITRVFHVWYKNSVTGEHLLINFNGNMSGVIKRHVMVTSTPASGFGKVNLSLDDSSYKDIYHFSTHENAYDYLLRQIQK